MATTRTLLYGALILLTIDGILELAFISSMVRWLHVRAGDGPFDINDDGNVFPIRVKPETLAENQGHASNGAAGTAFIVVGFGGFLALWLRGRQLRRDGGLHGFARGFYNFWLTMTVLSAIYSLASFVYVMVKTNNHDNQDININAAARLGAQGFPAVPPYPYQEWVPQSWFAALLRLPLAHDGDRSSIKSHLHTARGWQYNLIPMFLLGFAVVALAFVDRMTHNQRQSREMGADRVERQKEAAQYSP